MGDDDNDSTFITENMDMKLPNWLRKYARHKKKTMNCGNIPELKLK